MSSCTFCGKNHRAGSSMNRAESDLLGTVIESIEICGEARAGFAQLAHPQQIFNDPAMLAPMIRFMEGGRAEWATGQKGTTVSDLIEWANSGWPLAGAETAQIQWEDGYRDSFVISECGTDGFDHGAYAAGDPACTFEYRAATNLVPVPVKAVVSMGFGSDIDGADILRWAEAMSVAMQTVRMAGGQVELSGCVSSAHSPRKPGRMNWLWPIADTRYPMPLGVEAFFVGNPAMNRVMKFAVADSVTAYDGFYSDYVVDQGSPMPIDLFSLPAEWHDGRIIPGPRMYENGFTNVYGEQRDYCSMSGNKVSHDEMVRDILGALGWKVAE